MRALNTHSKLMKLLGYGAACALLALAPVPAVASKFKVLHSFCGPKDGCDPEGGLVADPAGTVYGFAHMGGSSTGGTVFALQRGDSGKLHYKRLYDFCKKEICSDEGPAGNLIVDTQGNLYGYADLLDNGYGSIIELSPPANGSTKWTKRVLYYFCSQQYCADGAQPVGGLTYAGSASGTPYDGSSPLFGAASIGGAYGKGAVFELTNNAGHWTETTLYNFCPVYPQCADGVGPSGSLLVDQAGDLFGLTAYGGSKKYRNTSSGNGVVYGLSPNGDSWKETVLWAFCHDKHCSDGAKPLGDLIADARGTFYGTAIEGGKSCPPDPNDGCGVVFKIVPNGGHSEEAVVHIFCRKTDCTDGSHPEAGLTPNSSGELVGTTFQGGGHDIDVFGQGGGTIFELAGGTHKVLHQFCALQGCADGEYPDAKVYIDLSDVAYGTTPDGGDFAGGVLYQVRP